MNKIIRKSENQESKKPGSWSYPNPRTEDPEGHKLQRRYERIPGILLWSTIIGMLVVSWKLPVWAAVFIIVYDVYWIYRTIYIATHSIFGYRKMARWKKIDWLYRLKRIFEGDGLLDDLKKEIQETIKRLKTEKISRKERRVLKQVLIERKNFIKRAEEDLKNKKDFLNWEKVYHVIMMPTAGEEAAIIEPAINAVLNANYPKEKMIILLAMEEREPEEKRRLKEKILREKFGDKFFAFISTTHKVAKGEMKCKASNTTYAAKKLKKFLEKNNIPLEHVVLSNFDCETAAHSEYFAALSYAFATEPDRHRHAYQPIPIYHNNIWDVTAITRILMTGCSFWHMVKAMQPEKMCTFSSHAESFKTIVEMDYWPVNVISEDSLIFWKGFSYFEGEYRVKPIYLPVSMDAVLGNNYFHSLRNQYLQKHRWAYGIENFPLFWRAFRRAKKISLLTKLRKTFMYVEGHYSWAVTPLILAFLGWLPLFFGGDEFRQLVLAHNLPYITRILMTIAMLGLVVSMFMSFFLLPPKPEKTSNWKYFSLFFQWFLAPFVFLLSAIPAIHAQTRIMLGKYMGEFWVTEKIIRKDKKIN